MGKDHKYAMTPLQCKLARTACCWTKEDLAARAGCCAMSVSRFELDYQTGEGQRTSWKMQEACERTGIVFKPHGVEYPKDWDEVRKAG